jgi:hypothetical protein
MLNRYDVILELIRRAHKEFVDKPPVKNRQPVVHSHTGDSSFDLVFKTRRYRWAAMPFFLIISTSLFLLSLQSGEPFYVALFGIFLLVGVPIFTIGFFKSPVLIATDLDYLYIHFPSDQIRAPIRAHVDQVENICFHYHQVYTQHGAHPSTDLTIYLSGGVKITASNFDKSNEEMYFKLCEWLERYNEPFDQQ